jgi:predicted ATPase/class 3 adenylate cyclase
MEKCPRCGEQVAERAKFCPECGAALEAAAPAREERKVVTVLFCDLVGSTAQAERLDPEDVRAMLSSYHERVRADIERFGGTVEKFIGDAVMAVFGAPVAHEDDPERAVRSALAVRETAVEDGGFQVRVAVNTGEALVTLGARPAEGEAMVAGDVVNTAARLQSAAPANGILVGEQTYRATDRAIEYREHEPVQAKGKTEPVAAWEAMQARSRFGVDVASYDTPLVGRAQELELLVAALTRSQSERAPQLVTLVGVPGIGKSRLLAELFGAIDRGDQLVTWRQGRSLPYGEGVSYWALGEMVKAQAGILETDAPDAAAAKLSDAVRALLTDSTEASWVETHLRPLAGIGGDETTTDRSGEAFAAWRRFFEALGEQRSLVLVFEDLHWADDGLLDFVDQLVDWLSDVPVLVVATARPELLARRPAWGGGKANATIVSLSPLSDAETARLVHGLLEQSVLPAEVQSVLLERAGGNPLYAEEFVRMFGERGLADADLPESVQGIIAARLDGLSGEDKELLQDAAVVGKVFWSGALAEIGSRDRTAVEDRLHTLERREFVRRERRSSVAGENEYAFRHLLVRDVAYGAIPRATRAERHRRAADWIEALGRPEDHADLLAHHYLSALELSRAAGLDPGLLAGSAANALRRAGDRAFGLNAFGSAARFYDEALELGVDDELRPQVLFRLGSALHRAADERRIEVLEEARDAHLVLGDPETAAEASALLAEAFWYRGQNDPSRKHLDRALELVRGRGATPAAARVLAGAARYSMLAGEHREAVRVGGEALAMAEQLGLEDVIPNVLNSIGTARANGGDRSGIADLERAIETALATNNPDAARAYNNLASTLTWYGELGRAGELWLEGKAVAERLGNATVGRFIAWQLIWVDHTAGKWDAALAAAEEFIAECEAGSPHYSHGSAYAIRADILLARDDAERALAAAERSLELAREVKDPQAVHPALALMLKVDLELGRTERARKVAAELMSSLGRTENDEGLMQLALAAHELGIADDVSSLVARASDRRWTQIIALVADGRFEQAAEQLSEIGDRSTEAEVRLLAAAELAAGGHRGEADEQLRKALAFYRSVGATRYIREGEALLVKSA